jgi:hypothetical protein
MALAGRLVTGCRALDHRQAPVRPE